MDPNLPPFACRYTPEFAELLAGLGVSLAISTYQAGKVLLVSSDGERLTQLPRSFPTPMGIAVEGSRMAIAAKDELVLLADDPRLAATYPRKPGHYDALYMPRSTHFCGPLAVHDLAWGRDGLVGVCTLFSCLLAPDDRFSFRPLWRPPFVSSLAPEDRCHLNGLAMREGVPRFVTALGATDTVEGWREGKLAGGVLIDVGSGEIALSGLAMPHSPRVFGEKLWLLLAASGELVVADPEAGRREVVNRVPGFARGLARHEDYLFAGFSKLRPGRAFDDLPLARPGASRCGVAAIHAPTGAIVGELEYINSCSEIYDVQVLPGVRRPGILGPESPFRRNGLSLPDATYWGSETPA